MKVRKLRRRSIEKKLLMQISLVFFAAYIAFSAASFSMLYETIFRQIVADNKQILKNVQGQLSAVIDTCTQLGTQVISDESLAEKISYVNETDYPYVAASHVSTMLRQYIRSTPYVKSIGLITPSRSYHSTGVGYEATLDAVKQQAWFQEFASGEEKSIHSPAFYDHDGYRYMAVASVQRYHNVFSKDKEECFLFMMLSPDTLTKLVNVQDLLVTNNWGDSLIPSGSIVESDVQALRYEDGVASIGKHFIFRSHLERVNWNIYLPVAADVIYGGAVSSMVILFLLFALCLVLMLALLSMTIRKMLKPVDTLKNAMEFSAKGRFDVRAEVKSGDEFEYLAGGYNDLIDRLQGYINELRENEAVRSQMQNDLLMSQTHPHFIYNTLNSAVYLMEDGNTQEAIDVIDALIDILQSSVRLGEKEIFTTVEDELRLLDAYLCIQRVRYPDAFTCTVECEQSMRRQYLPRVVIQPLVENALFHGILPSERPGTIWVKIYKDSAGRLAISVRDDGVGIDNLSGILERPAEKGHGIGLENIRNRIDYLFGSLPAGIEISLEPSKGTTVLLYLPIDE